MSNEAAAATPEGSPSATAVSTENANPTPAWFARFPVPQITITMYIPTSSVGAVIGRRGSTIANIQKQAQTPDAPAVRVSIVGHPQDATGTSSGISVANAADAAVPGTEASSVNDSSSDAHSNSHVPQAANSGSVPFTYTPLDFTDLAWTPVVIRADPLAAWTVAQKLEPLCGGPGALQDTIVDIPIGRQKHATLVGKKGLTLMQTSADTHCRIWVPPKELKLDVIQLEGSLSECLACLKAIYDLMSPSISNAGDASGGRSRGPPTGPILPIYSQQPPVVTPATPNPQSSTTPSSQTYTHQTQLVLPTLPSQTKLRSVGRKTDTLIKKRKITNKPASQPSQEPNENPVQAEASTDETTSEPKDEERSHQESNTEEESGSNTANNPANTNVDAPPPGTWKLTILGTSEAQVVNAYTILAKWADQQHHYATAAASTDGSPNTGTTSPPTTPNSKTSGGRGNTPGRGAKSGRGSGNGGGRGTGNKGRKAKGRGIQAPSSSENPSSRVPPSSTKSD